MRFKRYNENKIWHCARRRANLSTSTHEARHLPPGVQSTISSLSLSLPSAPLYYVTYQCTDKAVRNVPITELPHSRVSNLVLNLNLASHSESSSAAKHREAAMSPTDSQLPHSMTKAMEGEGLMGVLDVLAPPSPPDWDWANGC